MRKLSVTKKSVKATSAFYERPAKERQPHIDKYVEFAVTAISLSARRAIASSLEDGNE